MLFERFSGSWRLSIFSRQAMACSSTFRLGGELPGASEKGEAAFDASEVLRD